MKQAIRLFIVFVFLLNGLFVGHSAFADGTLDIYWIDTEGGAATLIVTPEGESVLVDTGNPGFRDPDRIVKVATREAGLKQIDHLIITHFHKDHFGGASTLATLLPIRHVHDNGIFEGMPDRPDKSYLEFHSEKRSVLEPGTFIELKQPSNRLPLQLICLGARKKYIKPETIQAKENREVASRHTPKERDFSDNANSAVLLLKYGDFRFFDGGDLTWNQEFELVHPYNLVGTVDVYQVTHHGLDVSNNPVVLQSLQPKVAIMNNGHKKGCAPEVFANLKETKSLEAIYQVHKNLRPDGAINNVDEEYIANTQPTDQCEGHPIKLSVSSDSKKYTVEIPTNDHSRTYDTRLR
jgi:competence protein ComEC